MKKKSTNQFIVQSFIKHAPEATKVVFSQFRSMYHIHTNILRESFSHELCTCSPSGSEKTGGVKGKKKKMVRVIHRTDVYVRLQIFDIDIDVIGSLGPRRSSLKPAAGSFVSFPPSQNWTLPIAKERKRRRKSRRERARAREIAHISLSRCIPNEISRAIFCSHICAPWKRVVSRIRRRFWYFFSLRDSHTYNNKKT